ncbi:hypothetical protein ABFS82_10G112600 [Erythranthe guttata]
MYSGIAMRIAGESPCWDWTDKTDIIKKRSIFFVQKFKKLAISTWMTICRVGQEDSSRVFHSLKVGFSLTLVSLLYLLEPLFQGIGQNAIWAVMTVVVVLEFTAGATLCKGLNRGIGTLLAGSLAFLIQYIAEESSHIFRAIFIGTAVFVIACVNEYFSNEDRKAAKDTTLEDPIYKGYKAVLDSKSSDETLAMHASWEPCHSRYCYRLPWQHYVKLGEVLRRFGYTVVALHGCLQTQIQTPRSVRALFKDPCIRVAGEVSKALIELSESIQNRRQCSPEIISDHLHEALQDLDAALKSQPRLFLGPNTATKNMLTFAAVTHKSSTTTRGGGVSLASVKTDSSALLQWKSKRAAKEQANNNDSLRPTLSKIAMITSLEFSEALPFAAFASLLVEAVARLDLVIDEVEELGRVANFREFNTCDADQVTKTCTKPTTPLHNHLPSHGVD